MKRNYERQHHIGGINAPERKCPRPTASGTLQYGHLGEIFDARLEDGLVFLAGVVEGDGGTDALGVAHFAEDASAGGGDALDGVK